MRSWRAGGGQVDDPAVPALSFQAQSQGSITLKIIPATQEEDRLKDSKVMGELEVGGGGSGGGGGAVIREEITRLVLGVCAQWRTLIQSQSDSFVCTQPLLNRARCSLLIKKTRFFSLE